MRVKIARDVFIEAEVNMDMEDIRNALLEARQDATDNPDRLSVAAFVSACWQCLHALTDEQIATLSPSTAKLVSKGLRDLADRFDAERIRKEQS